MLSSLWYYDWEYWKSYQKVTFDGTNKLILVNQGITTLNWQEDVYSAWKDWMHWANHNNLAFQPAMRSVGGDFITADGTRRVGSSYFLMNGWRLRTWQGNHRLTIVGNVYTEESDAIYVPTEGNYSIVIEQTVSALTETVYLQGSSTGGGTGGTGASAEEVANEVWNTPATDHLSTGTMGQFINLVKAMTETTANSVATMKTQLNTATQLIQTLMKYEKNRTKIDQQAKTMTVYDDDGVTVLKVFDLKDFAGNPSITEVAERVPK
jgi:hypothetical protein